MLALTSYSQPMATMVDTTVSMLDALIRHTPLVRSTYQIAGRLVVRGSARSPDTGIVTDADGTRIWQIPYGGTETMSPP